MLAADQQGFLLCLAACIVPETAGAPTQITGPLLAAIEQQLKPRPHLQQLEFKLLLLAIRPLKGAKEPPPARSAPSTGQLTYGRRVRHPDHGLGGRRRHRRQRAGGALRGGRADRRAGMGSTLQRRRVHRQRIGNGGKLFFNSGAIGNRGQTLTVACARGCGGSTLAYTGTSIEIPQLSLDRWGIAGLSLADLAPRMKRYKAQNNVHELPDEDINENNQLFAAGCHALGYGVKRFPDNIKGCKARACATWAALTKPSGAPTGFSCPSPKRSACR